MKGLVVKIGRIRKAWRVSVRGYGHSDICFAPSAGKARLGVWQSIDDPRLRIVDVCARRAVEHDLILPVRSPIADLLSEDEAHCLLHAFGGNGDPVRAGYRDYFFTRRNDPPLVALAGRGLVVPMDGDGFGENMTYFVLTAEGRNVALSMVPEYRQ